MANKPQQKVSASSQAYLEIEEIKEDVLVLKDSSMRAVIYVSSINFDLKSENERMAIISSFQAFLNSLNFPIQIMINSRKIDLDEYLSKLKDLEKSQNNELLRLQTADYVSFVSGLLEEVNIMDKMFFVVIPYYPPVLNQSFMDKIFKGNKKIGPSNFETNKIQLMDRVDVIVSGLKSIGLNCASLDTNGLIQLFYSVYNPETARTEKVKNPETLTAGVVTLSKTPKEPEHMEI